MTHLTPEQLDALLSSHAATASEASAAAAAEAHLHLCPACAAEFATLRDTFSLFRQATAVHAAHELRNQPPLAIPTRSLLFPTLQPTHWFAVAATLLIALLPLQTFRPHPIQSAPAEAYTALDSAEHQSDSALLDDVDREVYAAVPTSMQALADPTQSDSESADSASISIQNTDQTPNQRTN